MLEKYNKHFFFAGYTIAATSFAASAISYFIEKGVSNISVDTLILMIGFAVSAIVINFGIWCLCYGKQEKTPIGGHVTEPGRPFKKRYPRKPKFNHNNLHVKEVRGKPVQLD